MLEALSLVLLAGSMNGSFAAPMKRVRGWQWEHTWLVWSVLAMFVIPLAVALATVPALVNVYRASGPEALADTAFFGMIWGAGTVLFGLGIARIGVALGFGIVLGTSCALGTVAPMIILHRNRIFTPFGLLMLVGTCFILVGVAASAQAGRLRHVEEARRFREGSFVSGLGMCLLSGVGSSFMSVGLNEAIPISRAAETLGASHVASLNAAWPVLLGGGLVVNAVYSSFLMLHRKTIMQFRESAALNIGLTVTMALLWSGSNFVYSAGAQRMGSLGLILGWPIFMATIVLMANFWGILTGEWRGAGYRVMTWAVGGCFLLILGIWIIALGGNRQ